MLRKPGKSLFITVILILGGLFLAAPTPTQAGGWVVVTLETVPKDVRAGELIELTFMVRQHGQHPIHLPTAHLVAEHRDSDQMLRVDANPVAPRGRHVIEVTFPQAGIWDWRFEPAPFPSTGLLEPLTVLPPEPEQKPPSTGFQRDNRWVNHFLSWLLGNTTSVQAAGTSTSAANLETDPATYGKAVFVAKGCSSCHIHDAISVAWSMGLGPELSDYEPIPEYVHYWLRNAETLTADMLWGMPTLELSDEEIDALIAFLQMEVE